MPTEFPYRLLMGVVPVDFPLQQGLHVTINHTELPGMHKDSVSAVLFYFFPFSFQRGGFFYRNPVLKYS